LPASNRLCVVYYDYSRILIMYIIYVIHKVQLNLRMRYLLNGLGIFGLFNNMIGGK